VRPTRILIGVVAAAVLLTSCTTTSNSKSNKNTNGSGGTLTVALGTSIDSLDPAAQVTTAVMQQLSMIVETLTKLGPDGKAQPLLATSWQSASDGLSYTFTLRDGIKFTDGTPVDAAAVKWSLERINDPNTFKADPNVFTVLKNVDVVDATHVKINLKSPFPSLPAALSLAIAGISSPKAATVSPNTVQQIKKPVGSGPYMFGDYVSGDHLTLKANPDYWGDKPTYQTQVYKVVPEASSRYALLKSGGADVISDPPPSNLAALQKDNSLKAVLYDSPYVIQMQFNTQDKVIPALQQAKVRQAISYAVDRKSIINSVLFGAGTELTGVLPKIDNGYCDTATYDYNPDKAKQMLADLGVKNLSIRMMSPSGRYLNDYNVSQAVAGNLRAIGIKVTLANPTDFPTYLSTVNVAPDKATNRDLHLIGWGALYADASQALFQFDSADLPPKGYDGSLYTSPAYDALLKKANAETDDAARNQVYCQAQKMLVEDAPVIWLYGLKNVLVTSKQLDGIVGLPSNMFNTVYAKSAS
jgi:peptide/nickel transport system substrate-binding protein